jgi:hypothetical protein
MTQEVGMRVPYYNMVGENTRISGNLFNLFIE